MIPETFVQQVIFSNGLRIQTVQQLQCQVSEQECGYLSWKKQTETECAFEQKGTGNRLKISSRINFDTRKSLLGFIGILSRVQVGLAGGSGQNVLQTECKPIVVMAFAATTPPTAC